MLIKKNWRQTCYFDVKNDVDVHEFTFKTEKLTLIFKIWRHGWVLKTTYSYNFHFHLKALQIVRDRLRFFTIIFVTKFLKVIDQNIRLKHEWNSVKTHIKPSTSILDFIIYFFLRKRIKLLKLNRIHFCKWTYGYQKYR